jgi:hypothetical protein
MKNGTWNLVVTNVRKSPYGAMTRAVFPAVELFRIGTSGL